MDFLEHLKTFMSEQEANKLYNSLNNEEIHCLRMNELKVSDFSKICKESETPIVITKNGYSDMVLMSVELYEQTIAKMQTAILINEALNDPERNKDKVELNSFIKGIINNE